MIRTILSLSVLVLALSACLKERPFKEIRFTPVKAGDALASEPVVVKTQAGIKEAEAALAPDTSAPGYEPPSVKTARIELPDESILAIRTEGSDWCGAMGCNTDIYLKDGASYRPVGSVSFNLPAYSLSCDKKGYVLMNVTGEDRFRVWHLSGRLFEAMEQTIPMDSESPCLLLAGQ